MFPVATVVAEFERAATAEWISKQLLEMVPGWRCRTTMTDQGMGFQWQDRYLTGVARLLCTWHWLTLDAPKHFNRADSSGAVAFIRDRMLHARDEESFE